MDRAEPSRRDLILIGVAASAVLGGAIGYSLRDATDSVGGFEQAAATVAAVAAAVVGLSVRPAWPLSLGIVLGAFSDHWDDMGLPIAFDRVFVLTGVVSVLIRERLRSPEGLRTRPVDWLLALVAIYAVGSAMLAGTLDDDVPRFALLDRLAIVGFVVFYVMPKAFREARDRQVLLGCLVGLGAYLGLTALFEKVGPEALVWPGYINDPSVGTHLDRSRGPFAEAAANGLALYGCLLASVIAAITWRDPRWRRVAIVVAGLCALGILLTVTRASWIAAGAGTVVAMLAVHETRRHLIPAAAAVGAGVLIAFALIPGLQGQAESRTDDDKPIWDRKNSTAAAFRMIDERPTFGFGWGKFQAESPAYYRQPLDFPLTAQRNVHNVYLANAVELGLVGALLWFFGLVVVLVGALTRRGPPELRWWKVGLLAWTVCYLISALSTPLGFVLPTLLLWAWAGLLWGEEPGREPAPA